MRLVVILLAVIVSQTATAAQSKAQLFMPWPMLNAKLNSALSGNNSEFRTKVATSSLDAGGLNWMISNTEYLAATHSPTTHTNGSVISFSTQNSSLKVNIEKIAVDQIIEREVNGVVVRIHLKAECGPITLTQPKAQVESNFSIDWSSGAPKAKLTSTDLNWVQNSWTTNEFGCRGPEGLPAILKTEITQRLANAEIFKPYLSEFLAIEVGAMINASLEKIRQPLTFQTGSSRQTFKVGALINRPQGIIADLTVSDSATDKLLPTAASPSEALLNSLSTSTPSLLADKNLLEQITKSEMSARSQNFAFDLQSNLSFHKLMGNRFKQFFGWADLLNYSKKSPFPLTITKPEFGGLTIGKTGTLQTSFVLNGVVQSYRSEQWWNWIVIGGVANAEVELTVAQGKISYKTTITPKNAKLNYGAEYRAKFKKSGSPPAKRILAAVTGFQPKLSGSFMFPVIELAKAGSYQLSSIKWIDSNSFVLSWTELN